MEWSLGEEGEGEGVELEWKVVDVSYGQEVRVVPNIGHEGG